MRSEGGVADGAAGVPSEADGHGRTDGRGGVRLLCRTP